MSEISVVVVGSTSINSVVGNGDTVNVNVGNQTVGGGNGAAATIEAGAVTTIDATQTATVTNVGTAYAAKFNFSLPRGATGLSGPANSLSIGSVSTGATTSVSISGSAPSQTLSFVLQPGATGPANSLSIGSVSTGTTAAVSISGSAPSQTLSFVLPRGPAGPVSSLNIGTVVTGPDAAATITGTAPTQTLNLVLPQGATGVRGPQGDVGPAGPANSLTVAGVTTTTATTASVSITGVAPSQQISFVIPQGPQGPGGPYTDIQAGTVTTGAAGSAAKIDTVTSGGTVTLNFTIPRGADGNANLADEIPQPLGVARAGSALAAARADHVHAVPVISYGNLTGVPSTFAPSAHQHALADVTGLQAALDGKQASGTYVTLDGSGRIPSSVLPGYVDDIIEAASLSALTALTGEGGKLYVTVDTRRIYRWSGSAFVEIASSPGSTDAVTEGTTNLYFTTKRSADAAPVQSVNGKTGDVVIEAGGIAWSTAPTATTTVTKAGALSYDANYVYVANDVNQWRRAAIEDFTNPTISISSQPSNQTAVAGAATFSVTATATQNAELLYQWQRQAGGAGAWANIATGLSATLSLDSLSYAANNGDKYRVVITSGASGTGGTAVNGWYPAVATEVTPTASLTSSEATLTVAAAISINSQPQNVTLTNGSSASFSVSATTPGTGLSYQWQLSPDGTNWTSISGATSASYAINGVTETGYSGTRYRCIVSSSGYSDATSNAATLTVAPIVVTTQPANQTGQPVSGTTPNYSATFTSAASSPPGSPTIQWEVSTDGGASFSDLSGQTNSSLVLTGLTSSDSEKRYRARFQRSGWNTVRSNAATLTVPTDVITVTQQPTNQTATSSTYSIAASNLPSGTWSQVSFADGKWFAAPNDNLGGDYIATSVDGVNWTKTLNALPYAGSWSKVLFGNGTYVTFLVAGSVDGTWAATSTDGLSWTARQISGSRLSVAVSGFLSGGGGWFFAGNGASQASGKWMQSQDGVSWSVVSQSSAGALLSGFNRIVESADGSQLLAYQKSDFTGLYASIAPVTSLGVGQFVSIGRPLGVGAYTNDIIHDGVTFVAVGYSYATSLGLSAKYSGLSDSWSLGNLTPVPYSVAFRDGRYIASTASGIASSSDAQSWVVRQSAAGTSNDYAIAVTAGFVASAAGTPYTSQDGISWTQRSGTYWQPVVSGNKVFLSTSTNTATGGFLMTTEGVVSATFSSAATTSFGSPGIQWQKSLDGGANWSSIPGATSPSLLVRPTFGDNGSRYRAVFSRSGFSTVNSAAATLTANVPSSVLTITSQPSAAVASPAGEASFSITATATLGSTISYRWQRAAPGSGVFSDIPNATSSTLVLTGLTTPADNGSQYRCVVSATAGATTRTSTAVTLTVTPPLITISQQPSSTGSVIALNGVATLSVTASVTKSATLSYQWERKRYGVGDFAAVAGETSSTLSLTGLTADSDSDVYRVAVSATGGAVALYSSQCVIVYPKVSVGGLQAFATAAGGEVTLAASASSSAGVSVSYQWQKRESGAVEFANVTGATSPQLALTGLNIQADNGDAYRVVVSGTGGAASVTSIATTLIVALPVITIEQQPAAQTASNGAATFAVTASATAGAALSYQWQRSAYGVSDFVNVSGATSPSLSLSGLSNAANNGDLYRVAISATGGATSVTSAAVPLLVPVVLITITSQPSNQVASSGSATLSVSATATLGATVSYRWRRQAKGVGNFATVAGATSQTLALTGLTNTANNGDVYLVEISAAGAASSVISGSATVTVPSPVITIATQPSSTTASTAGEASFSVSAAATSGATISYQWQKQESGAGDFTNISAATSPTLSLSGLTHLGDNGDVYRVVLSSTDGAASVTSLAATLSVAAPVITIQSGSPQDFTIAEGGSLALVVYSTVLGSSTRSYQWQKQAAGGSGFVNVSGGTESSLTLALLALGDSGSKYRCIVSGSDGAASVTSREATVTVVVASVITITSQPTSQQAASNAATFSVTATVTGGATLSYQWQKQESGAGSFSNVTGATSRTLSLTGLTSSSDDNDFYRVVVSATGGAASVTSQAAKLSFATIAVIQITSQPASQTVVGGSATLTVSATVTQGAAIFYQWQKRESGSAAYSDILSATSATLTLTGLSSAFDNQDAYRVSISATGGAARVTSDEAVLTVTPTPYIVIESHPASRFASAGQANFTVLARAIEFTSLSYQWQKQDAGTGPFNPVAGANLATITLTGLTSIADNGDVYRVVVSGTNGAASVTSFPATLTVPLPEITLLSQPRSVLASAGTATFSVAASISYGSLRYQWRKREAGASTFSDMAGSTSSVLSLSGLTPAADNTDSYCVVVSAADGSGVSVTSDAATLNVPVPDLSITEQPRDAVSLDGSAVFSTSATVSDFAAVSYQWQVKKPGAATFADIISARSPTLSLSGLTQASNDGDAYRAMVSSTGAPDIFTRTATLGVPAPSLSITLQPTIQFAQYGAATFRVSATTSPYATLSYQWQRQAKGVGSFVDLSGRTSDTLSLTNLKASSDHSDIYRVIVTATAGRSASTYSTSVTSDPAPLSVGDRSNEVWAWGNNSSGQCGDTTFDPVVPTLRGPLGLRLNPATDAGISAVSAGGHHSLAITRQGRLAAWGLNGFGQLGTPSALNQNEPTYVGSSSNWTAVAAGKFHSAGIDGGSLYHWGDRLGTVGQNNSPERLGTASNWVSVACGLETIFAINSAGELWGLGDNASGQIGDGTTDGRSSLVRVGSATNWSKVFTSGLNSFAITTSGQLWGWGSGGGVGDGTITTRLSPVRIGTASNWVTGAAANSRAYAVNSSGELWGWGGLIGDGTEDARVIPKQIGIGNIWSSVSVNGSCTFATTSLGQLWGWGNNSHGQLGDSSVTTLLSPTRIGPQTNWGSVSVGIDFVAALTAW